MNECVYMCGCVKLIAHHDLTPTSEQVSDENALEDPEVRKRLEDLHDKLKATQQQLAGEIRRKEEMEIQLACTSQVIICHNK